VHLHKGAQGLQPTALEQEEDQQRAERLGELAVQSPQAGADALQGVHCEKLIDLRYVQSEIFHSFRVGQYLHGRDVVLYVEQNGKQYHFCFRI
jgi:hypothetical protein